VIYETQPSLPFRLAATQKGKGIEKLIYPSAYTRGRYLSHQKTKLNQIQQKSMHP